MHLRHSYLNLSRSISARSRSICCSFGIAPVDLPIGYFFQLVYAQLYMDSCQRGTFGGDGVRS
jgi:hypothetical protein